MRWIGIRCAVGLTVSLFGLTTATSHAQQERSAPYVPTGLQLVDEATYRSIPLASTPLMGALPSSVDMSGHFPQPGDQGQQSSCVGWAVAYALKSYQEAIERHWALNSQDHIFSPAYIYNQIKMSSDCTKGGANYIEALNLLRREGVAPWSAFPYDATTCSKIPDRATKQTALPYIIADWRRVNVQDETEVKNQLAAGFPVLSGIVIDMPFYRLAKNVVYTQYSGQSLGAHAVVVVGYDDNKSAFKIINSWGTNWGESGFGWLSYSAFRQIAREGYVAQDVVVVPPVPQPGPTPAPQPAPTPAQPMVSIGVPTIVHNVPVRHPLTGLLSPSMVVTVPGTISNAVGRSFQIVLRFSLPVGRPLFANPAEAVYRDSQGLVATGTPPTSVNSATVSLAQLPISIPYYALNFAFTGGRFTYVVNLTAFVYIDNYVVAQSQTVQFVFTY